MHWYHCFHQYLTPYFSPVCASPPSLVGHQLKELKPEQLRCIFFGPLQVRSKLYDLFNLCVCVLVIIILCVCVSNHNVVSHMFVKVSMVSVCLVVASLALGCVTFLIYRRVHLNATNWAQLHQYHRCHHYHHHFFFFVILTSVCNYITFSFSRKHLFLQAQTTETCCSRLPAPQVNNQ